MTSNSVVFDNVRAKAIVAQLLLNVADLRYGGASVSVKMHDGRLVEVSYSRTEHTRDLEKSSDKK